MRPDAIFDEFFIISVALAGLFGLCLGSFATALIYRIPRDIPWIRNRDGKLSRSRCPSCDAPLGVIDLVPFFSWAFSKGRCRHCDEKIPAFYPLTELTCCVLVATLYAIWGNEWASVPIILLVPFLIAIVVIDWQHMIIPDDLNIAVFILGIAYVFLPGGEDWLLPLLGGLALPGVFWLVSIPLKMWKGREALGLGDVKFLAGAGLFIGMDGIPAFLFFSGVGGLLCALYSRLKGQKDAFPFGPALVFSLFLHLFLTGLGFDSSGIY